MQFMNNRAFRAAGVVLGFVLTTSLAMAGEAVFRLPVETHFGNVTLNPGEYRIITPSATSSIGVVYLYGNGEFRATLPLTIGGHPEAGRSYLEAVNIGGEYYVTKYNAGSSGQILTFALPKAILEEARLHRQSKPLTVEGE
ncbi:MAG: hypothetical protein JO340_17035 [Acidobacteriaceae bacterium]|nr:hypothetical protein [Acidobacteriaceae bacterium]